jgi:predicted transcriptional regulator
MHHLKKSRALTMHSQGYLIARIAAELGVTAAEVRKCCEKPRGRAASGRQRERDTESKAVAELRREGCDEGLIAMYFPGAAQARSEA